MITPLRPAGGAGAPKCFPAFWSELPVVVARGETDLALELRQAPTFARGDEHRERLMNQRALGTYPGELRGFTNECVV